MLVTFIVVGNRAFYRQGNRVYTYQYNAEFMLELYRIHAYIQLTSTFARVVSLLSNFLFHLTKRITRSSVQQVTQPLLPT